MAKIKYRIIGDVGERRSFIGSDDLVCRLNFDDGTDGYITVGSVVAPVKDAAAQVDMRRLPDGEYTPHLYTDGGRIRLEGFIKRGERLIPSPLSEYTLRGLLVRVDELEVALKEARREIDSIKEKTEKRLEF